MRLKICKCPSCGKQRLISIDKDNPLCCVIEEMKVIGYKDV